MLIFLATPLSSVTYDCRILSEYRLATKVSTQTLTNEQNIVNIYISLINRISCWKCPNETFSDIKTLNTTPLHTTPARRYTDILRIDSLDCLFVVCRYLASSIQSTLIQPYKSPISSKIQVDNYRIRPNKRTCSNNRTPPFSLLFFFILFFIFWNPVIIISGPSHATIFGSSVLHPG